MYYTTSGAYRRTKRILDYVNIVLTVCICILFLLILVFRSRSGYLFSIIFFAGAALNGSTAAKRFMDKQKAAGSFTLIITAILLGMAILCLLAVL